MIINKSTRCYLVAIFCIFFANSLLSAQTADLIVEDVWWSPGNPNVGQEVTLQGRIVNTGDAAVTEDFYVDFTVNGSSLTGEVGFLVTDDLSANSGQVIVEQIWTYQGVYPFVTLDVDLFEDVDEIDEDNNGRTEDFYIEYSDLTVSHLRSHFADRLTGMLFDATVTNLGPGNTLRDSNLDWAVDHGDGQWDPVTTSRVTYDFGAIGANDIQSHHFDLSFFDITSMNLFADASFEIEEADESNNDTAKKL